VRLLLVALVVAGVACGGGPTGPGLDGELVIDGDVRILFVGNSLTYTNDLPGTVEAVAAAAGLDVGTGMVAQPNFSLEDHWERGIGDVIREVAPDFVVVQQGPSSTPANQEYLRQWTEVVASAVADAGGKTALLMVWPPLSQAERFDLVRDSYRNAAQATGGWFIPAGEAFRPLLGRGDPAYSPFGGDGFHPSAVGTIMSAFVIVGTLLDQPITGLPLEMTAPGGVPSFTLTQESGDVLYPLADSVVAAWSGSQPGG
jgi:hypothetical protein